MVDVADHGEELTRLLAQHRHILQAYLTVAVGDNQDAEDLYQEAVMAIWEHRAEFRLGTDFRAWALTIARNRTLAFHKNKKSRASPIDPRSLDALAAAAEQVFDHSDIPGRKRALHECLDRLQPAAREALELRYAKQEPMEDSARRAGRSIQGFYGILKRARQALRACVERKLGVSGGAS
jgi:RNA polymerase sigma-70 factor, ECF subfamily